MDRTLAVFAVACSLLAGVAHACLWDRDTLAAEAKGLPGITEIITGRFDRFPTLFYEMRLERVTAAIVSDPDNLGLYDDAGVACDRLGRSDEAIAWMERKLLVMDRLESEGADVGEHRYRYLANLGTFLVHRWLKSGSDREDMTDVERSRELIAAAIELNPDAHFGYTDQWADDANDRGGTEYPIELIKPRGKIGDLQKCPFFGFQNGCKDRGVSFIGLA